MDTTHPGGASHPIHSPPPSGSASAQRHWRKQSFNKIFSIPVNLQHMNFRQKQICINRARQASKHLNKRLSHTFKQSMDLAQEKGACSRLASPLIEQFGFTLHKGVFHNALALRNWQPLQAPSTCGCGAKFSEGYALSCPKGGFPSSRHEIRDLTVIFWQKFAVMFVLNLNCNTSLGKSLQVPHLTLRMVHVSTLLPRVCGEIGLEELISVSEFSTPMPPPTSNLAYPPTTINGFEEACLWVENQLVFSATGGMAKVATVFYKRLALCFAVNWDHPCSFIPCPGWSGGFRGMQMHPLWRLVLYFLRKQLHDSLKITAVECSNNNQAQLHTHISAPYWSPDAWLDLELLQDIQFGRLRDRKWAWYPKIFLIRFTRQWLNPPF